MSAERTEAPAPPPDNAVRALHVVLRSSETGFYLRRLEHPPEYTATFEQALVFDYVQDHVPLLIQKVRKSLGQYWQAVPLRISDVLETCDACHEMFGVPEIQFTGRSFYCVCCATESALRP